MCSWRPVVVTAPQTPLFSFHPSAVPWQFISVSSCLHVSDVRVTTLSLSLVVLFTMNTENWLFLFVTVFKLVKGSTNFHLATSHKQTHHIYSYLFLPRCFLGLSPFLLLFCGLSMPWSCVSKAGNNNSAEVLVVLSWMVVVGCVF